MVALERQDRRTASRGTNKVVRGIGSRLDWGEKIREGRLDGETNLYLGSAGGVDDRAEQAAGAARRIVMKSGARGVAARHAAGAAVMLAVTSAAGGQVELGRNQKDRSKVAPEQNGQDEIGWRAPHR